MIQKRRGFALVSAIFIIVILSLIGGYMVSIAALMHQSTSLAGLGVKAYSAARSGLEWGIRNVTAGSGPYNCPTSPQTLNLTQAGLSNLSVTVTCSANSFTEYGVTYNVFRLTALGQYGTSGSVDYVSRQLYMTVIQPGI